jgi:DMSO/TMAO reductase YedYZ molybdopterin-dependent catalytic subunit
MNAKCARAALPASAHSGEQDLMALFVVRHEHDAATCPAQDPYTGAQFLNILNRANAREQGIHIQSEAVVTGEHALFIIAEADSESILRSFLEPFSTVGSVEVYPASTCAHVAASGGCEAPAIEQDPDSPFIEPHEACQVALDAGLVVHRAHPLNGETSVPALIGGSVMPNAHFYVRNHFQIPRLDPVHWRLNVSGLVERPLNLSLHDLHSMPSQDFLVTLECAGNGRARLDPPCEGEQWQYGAVSTAEWTGVLLREVLERAGVKPGAAEVLFRGWDSGALDADADPIAFERSLTIDDARESEALLAYAMNGEALPVHHGYPLRVVMPGWYAVASVKWLRDIEVIGSPFEGHFQTHRYFYEWQRGGDIVHEPVRLQRVRALITEPSQDEQVEAGEVAIRGVAWSGAASIGRVEVSIDDGRWQEARLLSERHRHSWQWWELLTRFDRTGTITIRARATDLAGRTQPDQPEWNRLGYGNNSMQSITVNVVS